jgi:hypothetical protein
MMRQRWMCISLRRMRSEGTVQGSIARDLELIGWRKRQWLVARNTCKDFRVPAQQLNSIEKHMMNAV